MRRRRRFGGRAVVVAVEIDRVLVAVGEAAARTPRVAPAGARPAGALPAENRGDARRAARIVHAAGDQVGVQCVRVLWRLRRTRVRCASAAWKWSGCFRWRRLGLRYVVRSGCWCRGAQNDRRCGDNTGSGCGEERWPAVESRAFEVRSGGRLVRRSARVKLDVSRVRVGGDQSERSALGDGGALGGGGGGGGRLR